MSKRSPNNDIYFYNHNKDYEISRQKNAYSEQDVDYQNSSQSRNNSQIAIIHDASHKIQFV